MEESLRMGNAGKLRVHIFVCIGEGFMWRLSGLVTPLGRRPSGRLNVSNQVIIFWFK